MASEEHSIEQKESEEGAGQAGGEQSATLEIDLQAHGAEQGEKETEKKEEEVKEEGGAQASSAEQPSIPQPPYDEDFNPFSDKGERGRRGREGRREGERKRVRV